MVLLERDAILLLRGEWARGAGQGAKHLLGLFFGTGVGGAFLEDGKPFRGSGFALEIGSMPFKRLGRSLEGLRPDCLETYVSGRVLAAIADRHGTAIGDIFIEARQRPALKVELDGFVRDMAMAIAEAVAVLSPDVTVVGGGICAMQGFPRDELRRLTEAIAPVSEMGRLLNLRWAELGWMAAEESAVLRAEEGAVGVNPKTDADRRRERHDESRHSRSLRRWSAPDGPAPGRLGRGRSAPAALRNRRKRS